MKRSSIYAFIILIAVIFVSSIGLYAGHFLFPPKEEKQQVEVIKQHTPPPVAYKHMSTQVNGRKQDINILEVDVSTGRAGIKPVLSFDSVFGFEKLSDMAQRKNAYAAVNAGFFYEYGRPAGMVCIDGKLIPNSTSMNPVFIVRNGKAHISYVKTELCLASGDKKMLLDNINAPGSAGKAILYTQEYGEDNRVEGKNTTMTIVNNTITKISEVMGSSTIPEGGMLVTLMGTKQEYKEKNPFSEGEKVEFTYKPDMGKEVQAYECGSWLIKDGKVVIGDRDAWVGTLMNRDPRTAIGIKNDGKVILITVDGRQPGHSAGMTGKELGEFLVKYGVKNAAMLDGGASTTMIINGKIVNKPSYEGKERPLGGGIIIQLTDDN